MLFKNQRHSTKRPSDRHELISFPTLNEYSSSLKKYKEKKTWHFSLLEWPHFGFMYSFCLAFVTECAHTRPSCENRRAWEPCAPIGLGPLEPREGRPLMRVNREWGRGKFPNWKLKCRYSRQVERMPGGHNPTKTLCSRTFHPISQ